METYDQRTAELMANSHAIVEGLRENCLNGGECEGCPQRPSPTVDCLFCARDRAAADLLDVLLKERAKRIFLPVACPACAPDALRSCGNCRWSGTEAFETSMDTVATYRRCSKFQDSCDRVRTQALGGRPCPVWELPPDVNFCRTCGRPLREGLIRPEEPAGE